MNSEIIDFTLHLAGKESFEDALDLRRVDPNAKLEELVDSARDAGVSTGNVMLLDTDLFRRDGPELTKRIRDAGFTATTMLDPRDHDAPELLERVAAAGCRGLKFHPYFLRLDASDFPEAVALAHQAQELGLWIAVCCSYGTVRVHDISGPRLVATLVRAGVTVPIVALHAGGAATLDVMSIALEAPNVLVETSFSIPFWSGSSVETDIAFSMRKVGTDRCLHGSDHPHVSVREAPRHLRAFLERHGFGEGEAHDVFSGTARRALGF